MISSISKMRNLFYYQNEEYHIFHYVVINVSLPRIHIMLFGRAIRNGFILILMIYDF